MNSSSGSDSDPGTSVFEDAIGGNVTEFSISGFSSAVSVEDVAADEDIILVLYSYNKNNSYNTFEVGSSSLSQEYLIEDPDHVSESETLNGEQDLTEEFHHSLRELESSLEGIEPADTSDERYLNQYATVGSEREFSILNSFTSSSSYDKVAATLRYTTDEVEMYVDNRNNNDISDSDLKELADRFTETIQIERDLFGEEPDVNHDGKVACLFTQNVNELGAKQGGVVTGFFYALDLLNISSAVDEGRRLSYEGNDMEVLYTFVPDPSGEYGTPISKEFAMNNIYPGVLLHELQHMINFNQHYFEKGASAEQGWLNEGLSHLAEDIPTLSEDGMLEGFGMENPARVSAYLSDISNVCFTCGTNLDQRGGTYLFLKYLYEQAQLGHFENVSSGPDFLWDLVNTSKRGVDNVTSVIFGSDSSHSFKDLLGYYALTLYLSNTGLNDDSWFSFIGLDTRGTVNDNRGTVLNGPSVQKVTSLPFTDALQGNAITFLQLSGALISENGGTIDMSFSSGSDFGGYLIKKE